jgi:hypothetical protein
MRIVASEQQFTLLEFYRLITEGHLGVIQPNVATRIVTAS